MKDAGDSVPFNFVDRMECFLLDEIGDLPANVQPKLLRFRQGRECERVEDCTTGNAEVRIIAGTNRDLDKAVREGPFREHLFFRLNVIRIEIPPFRGRPESIERLGVLTSVPS